MKFLGVSMRRARVTAIIGLAVGVVGFGATDLMAQKRKAKKALPDFIFGDFEATQSLGTRLDSAVGEGRKFQRTGAKILARAFVGPLTDYDLFLRKNGRFTLKRKVFSTNPTRVTGLISVKGKWRTNGRDIRFSGTGTNDVFVNDQGEVTEGIFKRTPVRLKSRISSSTGGTTWDLKMTFSETGVINLNFFPPILPIGPVR